MIRVLSSLGSLLAPLVAASGLVFLGCAPEVSPNINVHTAHLPATGPCTPEPAVTQDWRREVDTLRLTVNGPDMQGPLSVVGDGAALTLEQVPAGPGLTVALFGLTRDVRAWRGVVQDVTVQADQLLELDVLLARLADLSCARSPDEPRAFHTATVLDNGTILLAGGASSSADASASCDPGCRRMEATSSAAIYDPQTGLFRAVGPMAQPRMFHTATLLDDGRVAIVGGAAGARVHPSSDPEWPFPIEPIGPTDTVEIFDPTTARFSSGGQDPNGARVFAAAARMGDGRAIITGGIPAARTPRNDLSNAMNSTTLCGGSPFSCAPGPAMASRRAGHVAFRIEPSSGIEVAGVLVWGGSIDVGPVGGGSGFQLEAFRDGSTTAEVLDVAGMAESRNLFFAAGARYVDFRMLVAGGLWRNPDGSFTLAKVDNAGAEPTGPVYIYDASFGQSGGIAVGPPSGTPMRMSSTRLFATAAPLPDGRRAVIVGGYTDLAFTPSSALDIFNESQLQVVPLAVGGQARTLREPRGGSVAAANGDGTVVVFGGETPLGANRSPLGTAEIFADPVTPPGVAE